MRKALLLLLLLMPICLPSCSVVDKLTHLAESLNQLQPSVNPPEKLFIQIRLDSDVMRELQKTIELSINTIIQEELKIDKGCEYPKFLLKPFSHPIVRQDISLYYVIDLVPGQDKFIIAVLDEMQHHDKGISAPKYVELSANSDFFGDKHELVILIHDAQKELSTLHGDIKEFTHKAHDEYKTKHKQALYDIQKSESHAYHPHIALGRLQGDSIKKMVCGSESPDIVLQRIKDRIRNEALPAALASLDKKLQPSSFVVFNETKKYVVKTYLLNSVTSTVEKKIGPLLPPTGKYSVGTTYISLIDDTRMEKHNPPHKRELAIQVWYPAEKKRYKKAPLPYLNKSVEYVKNAIAEMKNVTGDQLSSVNSLVTNSYLDVPCAGKKTPYPVLVLSPGFGAPQETYTMLLEELASHGYIVLGINHPYVSNPTIFPDGRVILPDPLLKKIDTEESRARAGAEFKVWLEDINFVIAQLPHVNSSHTLLHDRLDLKNIGVLGHSFGGRAALEVCRSNKHVKAGVDLDGKLDATTSLTGLDKPFLFMLAERKDTKPLDQIRQLQAASTGAVQVVVLPGAEHGTFSDLNYVFKQWLHTSALDPLEGMETVRSTVVVFFEKYLK